jgi:CHAT domain-containing protein/tetratricopeptide (TPR) repeat protein
MTKTAQRPQPARILKHSDEDRMSVSLLSSALLRCRTVLFGLLAALGVAGSPSAAALPLTDGDSQEREIRGGESHAYTAELQAGQFLHVRVEENGIDLAVRLFDPKGTLVTGADSLDTNYAEATEDLAALAASAGSYRVEVTAAGEGSGRYLLQVQGPRAPSATDSVTADAVQTAWQGLTTPGISAIDQIQSLERAAALWREAGDVESFSEILFAIGKIRYEKLKKHDLALGDFRQTAEFWHRQAGRRSRIFEVESRTWMGRCLRNVERRQEAREVHKEALTLARELEIAGLQAENANLLGLLDLDDGEIRKGIDWQTQALDLARQAGDRSTEYRILNNLAISHEQLGSMQEAVALYIKALALAREIPDPIGETILLNNLGETYRSLGEPEKALENYRPAIERSDALKERSNTGAFLINQASAYRQQDQLDKARNSLDRALAIGREIQSKGIQVFALSHLSFLMLPLKQPEQAVEYAREAVSLAGSLEAQTISQYALGSALHGVGEAGAARTALDKALTLASQRGDRRQQAEISLALARLDRSVGTLDSALAHVRSAIALIESRRGRVLDMELRTSFLASKQDYYEFQIDTLMALHAKKPDGGFAAAALTASEQARARGLLDLLNEADVPLSADLALLEKEREARDAVSARDLFLRDLLIAKEPDPAKVAEAERKLDEAIERQENVQVELRQGSSHYQALTQPQILGFGEIQQQLLDGKALLLEYSLGTQRSFLWAVGPDSFASFELPGREEIEKLARRYYELLTVRNNRLPGELIPVWKKRIAEADLEAGNAARDLSRLILGPAEKMFGDRTLLIVADGALRYIPFAALPLPGTGEPLASRHEIVNLPSASVLAMLRRELRDRPTAPLTLAIFADPVFQKDDARFTRVGKAAGNQISNQPLRGGEEESVEIEFRRLTHSEKEAADIAALVPPGQVFKAIGFEASKEAVVSNRLKGYRNVHFATHGLLDSRPRLTSLVLSLYNGKGEHQDGFLRLADIYSLRLDADLVVLSACQTALGKEIRGEGLVGLTRGFMNAGAARVLASLWSVEDRSTAELMAGFYRGMLRDGLSPATALRQAQLAMAKNPVWQSPYYWAGFSLQGEWR